MSPFQSGYSSDQSDGPFKNDEFSNIVNISVQVGIMPYFGFQSADSPDIRNTIQLNLAMRRTFIMRPLETLESTAWATIPPSGLHALTFSAGMMAQTSNCFLEPKSNKKMKSCWLSWDSRCVWEETHFCSQHPLVMPPSSMKMLTSSDKPGKLTPKAACEMSLRWDSAKSVRGSIFWDRKVPLYLQDVMEH